jgi:hypothetical protein
MYKGVPFLENHQDEMKLRRNLRQSQYSGLDLVAFKDTFFLKSYVEQVIREIDLRPEWIYKDIDKRNTNRVEYLTNKIKDFKGKKSELRKLIKELKSIEGYNPMRDLKEYSLK